MIRFWKKRAKKEDSDVPPSDAAISPELLREIRRISFLARKQATQGLFGKYKSAFKGQGIEFEELRAYMPGDDVRAIHWGATARSQIPQIKRFREERELQVLLAVDVSASGRSGTGSQLRENLVAQLGATLAAVALTNNDKIGLVTFSDSIECYIPPRKTRGSIWRIIHEILYPNISHHRGTNIDALCRFLNSVLKRRTVVFILSDFIDTDFRDSLAVLARRHDVSAFVIKDPSELFLPEIGLLRVLNPETQQLSYIDTQDTAQREEYTQRNFQFRDAQSKIFTALGISHVSFWTNAPFLQELKRFFDRKGQGTIRTSAQEDSRTKEAIASATTARTREMR